MTHEECVMWHERAINGIQVQWFRSCDGIWHDVTGARTLSRCIADVNELRVKPEPRVVWIYVYEDGTTTGRIRDTRAQCEDMAVSRIGQAVRFVEQAE